MQLFIPSTFAINERDEKLLVARINTLARSAAIFGVEQVTIYQDRDQSDEERNAELMEKYLSYAECPPYLRKALIPKDPDLQYASIMDALQILSHGYSNQFREGVVTKSGGGVSRIDVGLENAVTVQEEMTEGKRVTVMNQNDKWEPIDHADITGFWSFTVESERKPLGKVLPGDVPVIGTSVHGEPLSAFRGAGVLEQEFAVVFGSAWRGIPDLVERGDCTEEQFSGMYNFVPEQHTKTVRTEEAVPIVLGVINALRHM